MNSALKEVKAIHTVLIIEEEKKKLFLSVDLFAAQQLLSLNFLLCFGCSHLIFIALCQLSLFIFVFCHINIDISSV